MGAMESSPDATERTPGGSPPPGQAGAATAKTRRPAAGRAPRAAKVNATKADASKAETSKADAAKVDGAKVNNATKAAKAPKASKAVRAARATKAVASDRAPVRRGPPDPSGGEGGDRALGVFRPPWRRPSRTALYNRRVQRASEQWPALALLGTRLFSHPEVVIGLLGGRPPVEVDGRVLNRGTQALIELATRLQPGGADGAPLIDPEVMRPQMRRMARAAMPVRTDVHVVGRVIPGPVGPPGLPVRLYRQFGAGLGAPGPGRGRPPAIVFFHGGGWVTGDLDTHDAVCRLLAAVSGCIVVAVAYRLAPEDPFPAAVEDALATYRWVHQHADEVGHAEGQVGVMGDSAGGNLAAVVARETRSGQAGPDVPAPVAQGLVYPALDARLDSASAHAFSDGFFLTRQSMEFFRACYLPDSDQWSSPRVSPVLAHDHGGLAPALVVTAGFDPLRDDGATYAAGLAAAGVEVDYRCYDDQVHGFMSMGIVPDSLSLATEVCDSMGRLMRRSVRAALAG
jgi:acetyl esterase